MRVDELRRRSSPRRSAGGRRRARSTRAAPPGLPFARRRRPRETPGAPARAGRGRSSPRRRAASGGWPPRARRPGTSGRECGRISRWIAAASSISRSILSLSIAARWRRAVSMAAGRLVGEEREQARVGGREVEDAAVARLLVRDREHAEPPARDRDRHDQALLAGGEADAGRRHGCRRVVDDGLPFRQLPGREFLRAEELAAEASLEKQPAVRRRRGRAFPSPRRSARSTGRGPRRRARRGRAGRPGRGRGRRATRARAGGLQLEVRLLDQARQPVRGEQPAQNEPEEGAELGGFFGPDAVQPEVPVDLALGGEGHPEAPLAVDRSVAARARAGRTLSLVPATAARTQASLSRRKRAPRRAPLQETAASARRDGRGRSGLRSGSSSALHRSRPSREAAAGVVTRPGLRGDGLTASASVG